MPNWMISQIVAYARTLNVIFEGHSASGISYPYIYMIRTPDGLVVGVSKDLIGIYHILNTIKFIKDNRGSI